MKTFVITLSKQFPSYHPRKGEQTNFLQKLINGEKKHTIRGNYEYWKKRIDAVNRGEGILSIRQWIGLPYKKPGQKEVLRLGKGEIGIQNINILEVVKMGNFGYQVIIDENIDFYGDGEDEAPLYENDGLDEFDFYEWFKYPIKNGCIIHFTDLRY